MSFWVGGGLSSHVVCPVLVLRTKREVCAGCTMLCIPAEGDRPEFRAGFSVVLPDEVLEQLGPSKDDAINGAELWWIAKSLELWGPILQSRCLLCFGDNQSAIAACVSGYSSSIYMARIAGAVHDLLCQYQVPAWFEWLQSEANPLDAASREDGEAALRRLHAAVVRVQPQLSVDLSEYHPRACQAQAPAMQ